MRLPKNHSVARAVTRKRPALRLVGVFFLLLLAACQHHPPRVAVEPLPAQEAHFARRQGWTGGDGVFSVALAPERFLWLFGDTFIGAVADGRHVDADLVNNTIALQRGRHPAEAAVEFFWGRAPDGRPAAFVQPADGLGWLWPYHGIRTAQGLYLFLIQIERTDDPLTFGFRVVATWLAHVPNPDDPPRDWRLTQVRVPWSGEKRLFGSAVLALGGDLFVYGVVDQAAGGLVRKEVILARVPAEAIGDFGQWRFYADGRWVADVEGAGAVCADVANEFSVSFQPALDRYVLLYTEHSLSEHIVLRLSAAPEGPWGDPVRVFRCPEAAWDPRIFCYAAKGHRAVAGAPDELIVTYTTNSTDFALIESDARLYRPRFLRLRFLRD
jgi:hypothetical protein